MNQFATNLKLLRKLKPVTQSQLALQVGKGQTTIANWEKGLSEPSLDELIDLSNFFDISVQDLLISKIEKGNLIGKSAKNFEQQKGNLKGNLIGNLIPEKGAKPPLGEGDKTAGNTTQDDRFWLLLQEVKRNSEKLDQLLVSAKSTITKKAQ